MKPISRDRDADDIDRQAAEWFAKLLDESTTPLERVAFRAWLEADPLHVAAYGELERLWRGAGELADASPTALNRRSVLRAAGAGIVVIGTGAAAYQYFRPDPGDYRTSIGETARINLSDGSVVELSTSTAISVAFSAGERVVILHRGEAYFTVARDIARPFSVVSGAIRTRALGTAFSVAIKDASIEVAVSEHRVNVSAPLQSLDVAEGQSVVFENNSLSRPVAADLDTTLAWRSGRLVFISTPLKDAVSAIGRWRRGKVIVMDAGLARRPVSIIVNVKRSSDVLRSLEDGLPIRVTTISPWLAFVYPR